MTKPKSARKALCGVTLTGIPKKLISKGAPANLRATQIWNATS